MNNNAEAHEIISFTMTQWYRISQSRAIAEQKRHGSPVPEAPVYRIEPISRNGKPYGVALYFMRSVGKGPLQEMVTSYETSGMGPEELVSKLQKAQFMHIAARRRMEGQPKPL